MFYAALLKKLRLLGLGRRKRRAGVALRSRRAGQALLRVESLEDRQMLSATTVTALLSFPTASNYGQPVELAAKVTTTPAAAKGSGPTGTIEFLDTVNGSTAAPTVLGTVNVASWNSAAHLTVGSLPEGSNSITAIYAPPTGSTTFLGSTSAPVVDTVTAAASHTSLLASGNPGVANTNVIFTAIVAGARPSWSGGPQVTAPTGTMNFTVDGATVPGTVTATTSGGNAIYQFTPTTPLALGTHSIVASYGGDVNYNASTSATLSEQIVAAVAGSVTVGTATAPATFWGGHQTLAISVNQDPTATPVTSGTVSYTDTWRGINLSSAVVTGVVFSSSTSDPKAEISGTALNTNGSVTTPVTFTMIVDAGTGRWYSRPKVSVEIIGSGINYLSNGLVATGGVAVVGTGSTTIPPLGFGFGGPIGGFERAVQSIFDDFGSGFHGHFGGWRF